MFMIKVYCKVKANYLQCNFNTSELNLSVIPFYSDTILWAHAGHRSAHTWFLKIGFIH